MRSEFVALIDTLFIPSSGGFEMVVKTKSAKTMKTRKVTQPHHALKGARRAGGRSGQPPKPKITYASLALGDKAHRAYEEALARIRAGLRRPYSNYINGR